MRRLKRYILTSMAVVGTLLLSGCAAESPDVPIVAPDDSPFYISLELSTTSGNSDAPSHAPVINSNGTRAGEVIKRVDELTVKSIIAYVVDADGPDKEKIAGVAYGDKVTIGTLTGTTRTIILNMGLSSLYTRKHKYRVYVLANISDDPNLTTGVIGKKIGEINDEVIKFNKGKFAFTPTILPADLSSIGLPFSTTVDDAAKIQIWLEDRKDYSTASNAYVVKADTGKEDATSEAEGVLALTPLFSRFDFAHKSGKENFNYPIQYKVGEGTSAPMETEMYVEFKQARVAGAAREVYTVLQTGSGDQTYKSPSLTLARGTSSSFAIVHSESGSTEAGKDNPAIYVPEYIPTVGTDKMLKYNQVTYLELDAVLKADADCKISGTVKDAINKTGDYASTPAASMPALGYYDDGQYQSTLMLWDDSKMNVANHWTKLVWESKTVGGETVSGYWVTYRHAIRHGAVGTGSSNADDGVVYPMEYGVVRNHLYQIGIESVSALPHPWETSTLIESPNKDINIKILPPKQWTYHRGGFNLTFE